MGIGLFLLLTYVPLTRAMDLGPMYTRDPEGNWSVRYQDLRYWRGLRLNWGTGNESQGSVSWSPKFGGQFPTPYPTRRVWVVCETPGDAVQAFGEALVAELLNDGDMVEVALFPFVQLPITEFRPPDLWVTLEQLEDESTTLPGFFSAEGTVAMTLTPRLHDNLTTSKASISAPFYASLIHYDQSRVGLISAAGRWKRIGDHMASSADLHRLLRTLRGDSELLPEVLGIDLLHGPIRCEPIQALADLGKELKQLKEGPAWMVHDLSAWSLQPGPDRRSRILKLREALVAEGWSVENETLETFEARLGQRRLSVGTQINPDWYGPSSWRSASTFASSPIGVQHFHPFSAKECIQFLEQRLEQGLSKAKLHALLAQLSPVRRQAIVDVLFNVPAEKGHEDAAIDPSHLYQIATQLSEPRLKQQ